MTGLPLFDRVETYRDRIPTLAARMYAVLSDGNWHSSTSLAKKLGHRFGDAIYRLRHGELGQPLRIDKRQVDEMTDAVWEYRLVGPADAPHEKEGLRAEVKRLREAVDRLQARIAELEGR